MSHVLIHQKKKARVIRHSMMNELNGQLAADLLYQDIKHGRISDRDPFGSPGSWFQVSNLRQASNSDE
jgi:hypothetical protein